jgi:thiol:disulfide interchange protein DsbD
MRWMLRLAAGLLVVAATPLAHSAHTAVRLVLSHTAVRPGETVWAGIQMQMEPAWHTYWENSGDSGLPTHIDWNLPASVNAGTTLWPVPERYETAGLVTYGYQGETFLLVPLSIGPTAAAGSLELKAKVSWLECIAEQCVPESRAVTAQLTVGADSRPSPDAKLFDTWRAKLPQPKPNNFARAWWDADGGSEGVRPLVIEWPSSAPLSGADFYGTSTNAVVRTAVQKLDAPSGRVRIRKEVEKPDNGGWPAELTGLLVEKPAGAAAVGSVVTLPIQSSGTGADSPALTAAGSGTGPASGRTSLLFSLGAAFLGGLILNLMPCVLPVIALKIFGFVAQSKESPARVRRLGLIYLLGVVTSFVVLAGCVIGLKSVGKQVSWGMQFGDARFLVIMTTLATVVALNLFGLFEVNLGGGTLTKASELASREGAGGAFFNGVLATLLSTPCSAPFLAGALGFAFAQSPLVILLTFVTIGLGLALPYVALSFQPGWLRFLPKPGVWMEHFKHAMGFPMLATAVWLFTLTVDHYGDVLWLGFFLVLVALALWVYGQFVQRGESRRGLALGIVAVLLATAYGYGLERKQHWRQPRPPTPAGAGEEILKEGPDGIEWHRWSPERVQKARAEGRPILVDFTAKWCTTCNVNKNTSIEIDSVRKKLKEINAVALLGDYTLVPDNITQELARFGRAAVPLVLVYPKDAAKPPVELPAVLTPGIVLEALDKASR